MTVQTHRSVPRVSVMVPCYNGAQTIRVALGSMLAQTFEDWECIVVDDGSTDDTWKVLQGLSDPRFRIHKLSQNRGRGWARAEALELAQGTFLSMLDADDWSYPEKLSALVERIERDEQMAYVCSAAAVSDESGNMVGRQGPTSDRTLEPKGRIGHTRFVNGTLLFRTDVVRRYGYDRSLRFCEDKDLLVQVTRDCLGAELSRILYSYSHPGSMSFRKMASSYEAHFAIWGKYRSTEPLRSTALTVESLMKREAYRAVYALGLGDKLVERRWSPPSQEELRSYERARTEVAAWEKSLDSAPVPR